VTDSVAQVPLDVAQQLGIRVMPFSLTINGEKYLDGVNLLPAELYRRMRNEKVFPQTSAPSVGEYLAVFLDCIRAGAQSVLCVTLSSRLSGGYSAACAAARLVREEFPDREAVVIDSKLATIAQGFVAVEAARLANKGASLEEVIAKVQDVQPRVGFAATLETLEYLALGGRIGKAAYLLGSLIQVKPILTIDEEGVVAPVYRVRGNLKALNKIVEYVSSKDGKHGRLHLAVMEADAPEQAAYLEKLAIEQFGPIDIWHTDFTPVMGTHAGPGVVGLGYFYEPVQDE
jgi:DegV family protein with EDD domain